MRGELKLYLAVIERAILDAQGSFSPDNERRTKAGAAKALQEPATFWLLCKDSDPLTPFTFRWLCEALGLNFHETRKKIQELILHGPSITKTRWEAVEIDWLLDSHERASTDAIKDDPFYRPEKTLKFMA